MAKNLIEIRGLTFVRNSRIIFNKVDLNIAEGKITAIMGPSGAGKTTILKLMSALLYPKEGQIFYDGHNIHELTRKKLYKTRENMGMLFQTGALFSDVNVFDNVAYPLREHTNLSEQLIKTLVLMKLDAVGLRGAVALYPDELSGGMARRVALARAIALDPKFIMYDEPFTGQDPISKGILVKLIKSLNEAMKITSVLVSHDVPETLSIADYAYVIADGKIIGQGTPNELKQSSSDKVQQFLNGLPDGPVRFHYPAQDYSEQLMAI
ncbi:MAG: ATP-binding cassette domain-containing protein [Gammaproteobacteria bacterium]|nr:ATP-binding cassette domain-containing protein [Gammaproteobacteria bacterium]